MRCGTVGVDITKMVRKRITERIDAIRRSGRKMSATKASLMAGYSRGTVGDIVRGMNKNPSMDVLDKLAAVLECDVEYLIGKQDNPRRGNNVGSLEATMVVAGTVEAGVFREMSSPEPWIDEVDLEKIRAPRNQRFETKRHFAFKVRGDSMNNAKPKPIVEGEYVLCVDTIDAELSITDNRIYVVRKVTDGGSRIEWTVKRARVFRNRIELHPESTNPVHKTYTVFPGTNDDDPLEEISVVGWCYGTFASLEG